MPISCACTEGFSDQECNCRAAARSARMLMDATLRPRQGLAWHNMCSVGACSCQLPPGSLEAFTQHTHTHTQSLTETASRMQSQHTYTHTITYSDYLQDAVTQHTYTHTHKKKSLTGCLLMQSLSTQVITMQGLHFCTHFTHTHTF